MIKEAITKNRSNSEASETTTVSIFANSSNSSQESQRSIDNKFLRMPKKIMNSPWGNPWIRALERHEEEQAKTKLEDIFNYIKSLYPFMKDKNLSNWIEQVCQSLSGKSAVEKVAELGRVDFLTTIENYLTERCQRMIVRINKGISNFSEEDLLKEKKEFEEKRKIGIISGSQENLSLQDEVIRIRNITLSGLNLLEKLKYLTKLEQIRYQTQCYLKMRNVIYEACNNYCEHSRHNSMTKDSSSNDNGAQKIACQLYDKVLTKHKPENRKKARQLWDSINNSGRELQNLETLLEKLGTCFCEGSLTDNHNHSFIAFLLQALKKYPVLCVEVNQVIQKQNRDQIYDNFEFDCERDYHQPTSSGERANVINAFKTLGKPDGYDIRVERVVL